ncbi:MULTISPECIES: ABC transporter substrate-binding protein [Rhizobium]|uniref:ABC transporter substrate-binding protein n=1 Tax=Rhizobium TaxID=379 RepID=UPI001B342B5F|nr:MULTISPECIES: ABC transporter substrate-binding protein [Rhizobium]MBX4906404.1 ABC transporter substrate-binding protein [Rhizobium bangladeshense]MBX5213568.1 ABC transporter substrate-binding protein [Rhizobium sp. NLR9a]MBX5219732.1 ABC transporter substrate-binding protein [Rhizobium sp. NLR8a]MBX5231084.1 ABC transporter substrate-binding protein [Rhizobium sp. NLR4a]MBX5243833.1 ABC transporter substrate-binding protein [Rhizobium sp. NLR3b]
MKKYLLGAAALTLISGSAMAQTILTANIEPATTWVRNFNPFNQTSSRQSTLDFIYEPLVIFNRFDSNKPVYRLAESFKLSDDLKSIEFKLRRNLKWSDGKPLTASDVKFTYDYLKKFPALDFVSIWTFVTDVQAVDGQTVRFTLANPSSLAAEQISQLPIVPEHVWKDVADPVTFANETPVGSGPLTEVPRFTGQTYDQCRNPNYWDNAHLKIDCMRFPQLADNNQILTATADGTLDWGVSFIPDIDNVYVSKDPAHFHYWYSPSSMVAFLFNLETANENNKKAFNDVKFRRAVGMALDRKTMIDVAGYGYPTLNEDPGLMGELYKSWADPSIKADFGKYATYDADAAKALLDEAGYKDKDGDGFRDNSDGSKIAFSIIVPNSWTDWVDTVNIAVEGMQAVGIDAKIETPEEAVWTGNLINGTFDAAINSLPASASPYYPYKRAFSASDKGKTRFTAQRWFNPDVEKLVTEFTQTADLAKQKEAMNKAQRIVAENMPVIPVFNNPNWYQYNTKRFTGWSTKENPFVNPSISRTNPARLLNLLALEPVK